MISMRFQCRHLVELGIGQDLLDHRQFKSKFSVKQNLLKLEKLFLPVVSIAAVSIESGLEQSDFIIETQGSNRYVRQLRDLFYRIRFSTIRAHEVILGGD